MWFRGIRDVAFITPEAGPFFKTGGLGDVCGELATALSNKGLNVTIFTYKYNNTEASQLRDTGFVGTVPVGDQELPTRILTAQNGEVTYYFLDVVDQFKKAYAGDKLNFAQGLSDGSFHAIEALVSAGLMPNPQVLHVHDWAGALVPLFLGTKYSDHPLFRNTASVLTVHNPVHTQAWIPGSRFPELGVDGKHWFGLVQRDNPDYFCILRGAIVHADKINAVSRGCRNEMLTTWGSGGLYEDYRARVGDFLGIPNGVDYSVWEPVDEREKPSIKAAFQRTVGFAVNDNIPLIGMIARISGQKRVREVVHVISRILWETKGGIQFVYVGKGNEEDGYYKWVRSELFELEANWPHNVCFIESDLTENQKPVFRAIDIFLYPSEFEPFGTKPVVALINRVPCVVRRIGGLADNFQEYQWLSGQGNGWVFENLDEDSLHNAIWRGINTFYHPQHWNQVTENAANGDWSWDNPAQEYINMYGWAYERAAL